MVCLKKVFLYFVLLNICSRVVVASDPPSPKPRAMSLSEAPREIQSAIRASGFVKENKLRVDLNKQSSGELLIHLEVETLRNFHLYDERIHFWVNPIKEIPEAQWSIEIVEKPDAIRFLDPISKELKFGFKGQSLFVLRARLINESPVDLPPDTTLPVVVYFQACNDKICLLPAAISVPVAIGEKLSDQNAGFFESITSKFRLNLTGSTSHPFSFFNALVLILAGLITAFTPCVYPLYPITLGIFSRWSQQSSIKPFWLALSYSAGLILSYALLGLVSAASGTVFGSLTQKPGFLLAVGVFLLVNALAFSGLIPFTVPQKLLQFFSGPQGPDTKVSGHYQYLTKAAFMGLGLGVVASPCVGPVLVSLLAWLSTALANSQQAYLWGFVLLSLFGLGLSLPFMALGHFVFKLHRTPKLGFLTPHMKHLGTGLMLVASLYYIVPAVQSLSGSAQHSKSLSEFFTVLNFSDWKQERIAMVDFRADWCVACKQLENETFSNENIIPYFKNKRLDFVKVDLTNMTPELQALSQKYGVVSLPAILIIKKNGEVCSEFSLYEFENAVKFSERLEKALNHCQ